MTEDQAYEDKVLTALDYVKDMIREGNVGDGDANLKLMDLDLTKFRMVVAEAVNARNYLDEMRVARQERDELESKLADKDRAISVREKQIEEMKLRESMHTGMCSAFQTALFTLAQGFASGGSK